MAVIMAESSPGRRRRLRRYLACLILGLLNGLPLRGLRPHSSSATLNTLRMELISRATVLAVTALAGPFDLCGIQVAFSRSFFHSCACLRSIVAKESLHMGCCKNLFKTEVSDSELPLVGVISSK